MTEDQPIPFVRPEFHCSNQLLHRIGEVLNSGVVTNNGPNVQLFERRMAEYLGTEEVVAVSSGSMALMVALAALDLNEGKILLPSYTYISTLNAIIHLGLEPLFCDIDPQTFTLDLNHLESLIKSHDDIRCIIPVNVFGVHPNLERISEMVKQNHLAILYDNAHGLGSGYNSELLPTTPGMQVFSLHATKVFPAIEGGLIAVSDSELLRKVKVLRNHGMAGNLSEIQNGYNAKLDEVRALIGLNTLSHFDEMLASRRETAHHIRQWLRKYDDLLTPQTIPDNVDSNYQNIGVVVNSSVLSNGISIKHVIDHLQSSGLMVRRYFHPPLHSVKEFGNGASLPATEHVWQHLISLPIHSHMPESTLNRMFDMLDKLCHRLRAQSLTRSL